MRSLPHLWHKIALLTLLISAGCRPAQAAAPDHVLTTSAQTDSLDWGKALEEFTAKEESYNRDPVLLNRSHRSQMLKYGFAGVIIVLMLALIFVTVVSIRQHVRINRAALMNDYLTLFNWMPIGYSRQRIYLDSSGNVADFENISPNPKYKEVFGDHRLGSQMSLPKWESVLQLYSQVITNRKITSSIDYYSAPDKHIHVVLHPSNKPGHVELFCSDITGLIETQDKLQIANDKLSMALEVGDIIAWQCNVATNSIVYDTLLHYTMPGAKFISDSKQVAIDIDQYYLNVHPEDVDHIRNVYKDLMGGRSDTIHEEYRVLMGDDPGSYEWVEARGAVYKRDKDGNVLSLIGSSIVITKHKMLEQDLMAAKTKAEESNRLKSAFLANMSHEIRTPLNAIVGFSEIIASSDSQEERDEYSGIIKNNNTLLLQLISDIIDLSKIESGTLEFNYSATDLDTLFREIEVSARTRQTNPDVQISYCPEHPECYASVERNRLTQVVTNLINNSMKFTDRGTIDFGYKAEEGWLYCHVKDTGIGIPESQIENIFGRFIKLNSFMQGSGLGLAISLSLVESMGGSMGVDSKEGEGSTFWFSIPYTAATPE